MEIPVIHSKRIYLRRLIEDDVTEESVGWMNNPYINQYLESRFSIQPIDSTRSFIKNGFEEEGQKKLCLCNGKYVDVIQFGKINE